MRPSSHKIKGEHIPLLPLSGGGYTRHFKNWLVSIWRIPAYTPKTALQLRNTIIMCDLRTRLRQALCIGL
jgi:hypothetical protein